MKAHNRRICSRCVYDDTVSGIVFDANGVCNYCHSHDDMDARFPTGPKGDAAIHDMVERIKAKGRGLKYDCAVGVSGGADSSYLLHLVVKWGLRPLAVHLDNTWNSATATQNIYAMVSSLGVDLETYVVDWREMSDLHMAFMRGGVRQIDVPTDIAFVAAIYLAAERHRIPFMLEGHSFRTEGISPLGWAYIDGRYVESVHERFGTIPVPSYPNMTIGRFIRWTAFRNISRLRPLWHLNYVKADAKKLLNETYGWQWYGGHHMENILSAFSNCFVLWRRNRIDYRLLGHAALVRSHQLERREVLEELATPPVCPPHIIDFVKRRYDLTDTAFEELMDGPERDWRDFDTYKRRFEQLRPLFWLLLKLNRIPEPFYTKFCLKQK